MTLSRWALALAIGVPFVVERAAHAKSEPSGEQEATPTKKPAWLWTDEERLAARFAPGPFAERMARQRALSERLARERGRPAPAGQRVGDFVDSREAPELFFPHEIVRGLLGDLCRWKSARRREEVGSLFAEAWARYGLPVDPLPLVEREARRIVEIEARVLEEPDVHRRTGRWLLDPCERTRLGHESCTEQTAMLGRIRTELGDDGYRAFLRLLYSELAPRMGTFVATGLTPAEAEAELRWTLGGGCGTSANLPPYLARERRHP